MTKMHSILNTWMGTTLANAKSPSARPVPKVRSHRNNAKLTAEQVLAILDLREKRGWSPGRIATKLKLPESQCSGVIHRGLGTRTVYLQHVSRGTNLGD